MIHGIGTIAFTQVTYTFITLQNNKPSGIPILWKTLLPCGTLPRQWLMCLTCAKISCKIIATMSQAWSRCIYHVELERIELSSWLSPHAVLQPVKTIIVPISECPPTNPNAADHSTSKTPSPIQFKVFTDNICEPTRTKRIPCY